MRISNTESISYLPIILTFIAKDILPDFRSAVLCNKAEYFTTRKVYSLHSYQQHPLATVSQHKKCHYFRERPSSVWFPNFLWMSVNSLYTFSYFSFSVSNADVSLGPLPFHWWQWLHTALFTVHPSMYLRNNVLENKSQYCKQLKRNRRTFCHGESKNRKIIF